MVHGSIRIISIGAVRPPIGRVRHNLRHDANARTDHDVARPDGDIAAIWQARIAVGVPGVRWPSTG